jgi:gas vesicle protein
MISSRNRGRDNFKKIALGSAVAGLFGYLAGLLTAPQSGKDTRQDIKTTADKGMAQAEKTLKQLHTDLDKALTEAKARGGDLSSKAQAELNKLVDKANDAKEKAREVLSAVHEGDAADKDLDKAIKDANTALDHLKQYLKK